MDPITVLIAETHAPFRQRLCRSLARQAGIQVVGEAADGRQVLRGVETLHPDVLLLDMQLVQVGEMEEFAHLRARSPTTKILILADVFEEEAIARAVLHGAQGHLLKTVRPAELIKAIRATQSGELWVSRKLLTRLLENLRQKPNDLRASLSAMRERLTEREQEIVIWVVQGMTNNEIAVQLGISATTVKKHLQNVFRKLQVRRRSQLLRVCFPAPLAPPPLSHASLQPDRCL